MTEPKNRARLEVLHYVMQFCITHEYGDDKRRWPGSHGFRETDHDKAEVGDLVAMSSAPVSKWYLSWVEKVETTQYGSRYLMESIEDGELCWWGNVGVPYLPRDIVKDFPQWRWTDKQFAFKDRWWNVCFKDRDAYITLPMLPEFGEANSVTLGTRTRFSLDEHRPSRSFDDWRKVTKAVMRDFYDECVSSRTGAKVA